MMYPTVSVGFRFLVEGEPDEYNVTQKGLSDEAFFDCLVSPGSTSDLSAERPGGARVAYTVITPKALDAELKGAVVSIPGEPRPLRVVGDPRPYPAGSLPPWWPFDRVAEVSHVEG